jgi:hypothetical protein
MGKLAIKIVLGCWLGSATVASADGVFAGYELGGSTVSGLGDHIRSAPSFRFAGGMRAGNVGVGISGGFDDPMFLFIDCYGDECNNLPDATLTDLSLDFKHAVRLAGPLALFGRARISSIRAGGALEGYVGRGYGIGGGVQIDGKVRALGLLCPVFFVLPYGPKIHAAAYLDTGTTRFTLHRAGDPSLPGAIGRTTVGFAIGSDF